MIIDTKTASHYPTLFTTCIDPSLLELINKSQALQVKLAKFETKFLNLAAPFIFFLPIRIIYGTVQAVAGLATTFFASLSLVFANETNARIAYFLIQEGKSHILHGISNIGRSFVEAIPFATSILESTNAINRILQNNDPLPFRFRYSVEYLQPSDYQSFSFLNFAFGFFFKKTT